MAVVPVSGTNIRILIGVPFQSDYKHTRWFDTDTEQRNYFANKSAIHTIAQANFQRSHGKTFVKVNKPIEGLRSANYMMFQNAEYNSKWFYAFVTELEYVNAQVTNVHFQLDVFQTWRFEVTFKPSFIVREHCKLWNADGSPVINTIDEGLNYGTEYDIVDTTQYVPNGGYKWLVIVSKEVIHGDSSEVTPTVIGTPQPLSYYMTPFKDDDVTPLILFENGEDVPITPPTQVLKQIYKSETAVNNIVSIFVTDYTGIPVSYKSGASTNTDDVLEFPKNGNQISSVVIGGTEIYTLYVEKVVDFAPHVRQVYPDKYSGFTKTAESKLLMYPYCQVILDDFKGNRVVIKPEYIDQDGISVTVKGSVGTGNKVSYSIQDYNHNRSDEQKLLTSNESALIQNTPNDIPVITDHLAAYLQGNRNAIENQKSSIVWNGVFGALGSLGSGVGAVKGGDLGGTINAGLGLVQGGGNMQLDLQAIQAKQQDISNVPPQISKMGGNTAYDAGNGYNGIFVIKKQIKPEYRNALKDYFNIFGYKVNRVKVPNFHTRRYWNYVQTAGCVVQGNLNNEDLNDFKSVLDKGITFWHTDDIGNYTLNNEVI